VTAQRALVWVDRQGREEALLAPSRPYLYPRLSPDGTRVVVNSGDRESDLWVWDLRRTTLTRLTFEPGFDFTPVWTPDGRNIVFTSVRDGGQQNLFVQASDGTGSAVRLTRSGNQQNPTGITPDGRQVVIHEVTPGAGRNIGLVALDSVLANAPSTVPPGNAVPLLETRFEERGGIVSPNGRWLAYEANSSGQFEIYVRPFPGVNAGQWQVSTGGGIQPLWSANGTELFYMGPNGTMMSTTVDADARSWSAGTPRRLFANPSYYTGGGGGFLTRHYDVTADGRRFLMVKDNSATASVNIAVVQNWHEELKRLVPTN
jgi:serine/threonine-protein kinase